MRFKKPDKKNALSIVEAAERDMKFTLSLEQTESSGPTIVRNIYECFRMLGDALLISKGMVAEDHIAPIQELISLKIDTGRPLQIIDNLRRLRHNINYYGYKPTSFEVEDALLMAKILFPPLLKEVKKGLQ